MILLNQFSASNVIQGKMSADWVRDYCAAHPDGRLFLIAGICDSVQAGEGKGQPWYKLHGEFRVRRPAHTPGEFVATKAFLPPIATDLILAGIQVAKASVPVGTQNEPAAPVTGKTRHEFVFIIGVKLSKSPVGYEYTCETISAPKASEAMERLLAEVESQATGEIAAMLGEPKQLPAPPKKGK